MVRLYLFAEGQTEQTFADTVLEPHLANFGIYLHPPILIAHARKKGIVHRGGGRKYLPMKNDIRRLLLQETDKNVFFTTMIDLYAIPTEFPGFDEAEPLHHLPQKRVEVIEKAFGEDIGDSRFIPHIQLHEYEAYLFSDPTWFSFFYDRHEAQIEKLKSIAAGYSTPELIDDGPSTAPSKRITREFPDYEVAKPVVGAQVAELIGLECIRTKCPHFAAWLSRLERLSNQK